MLHSSDQLDMAVNSIYYFYYAVCCNEQAQMIDVND